jgi:methionyl-tRNA synthetase
MAAELPLPKRIHAHGWLLFEQEKMSKSKGNVAYPEPIVKVLGNDALRYYLLRETVFGQDGNFSREALITRYEADLVNGLGNLASRTLAMIELYFGDHVPTRSSQSSPFKSFAEETAKGYMFFANHLNIGQSVSFIPEFVARVDKYLTDRKPWKMAEDPSQRQALADVLYDAVESLRWITVLAHPVIPDATQKIWAALGQSEPLGLVRIDKLEWGDLKPGTRIAKPEAVFPRVDKKEAIERIETMEQEIRNPGSAQPSAPATPASSGSTAPVAAQSTSAAAAPAEDPGVVKIGIEDFAKVEMRVGLVKSAEKVAGADKLLKLMVDVGDEVRQIVAGIATAYQPEELVGRKVVVVANLAPRKLRGVESNGMLLAASTAEGKPVLCTFAEEVPVGARLK